MKRIGIISDTHSTFDEPLRAFLQECDEIWCAGDIGSFEVPKQIASMGKPFVAVWGNIDDYNMRSQYPEWQMFEREGVKILMTHIGMRAGRYVPAVAQKIATYRPDIFICGHSHVLRVFFDERVGVLNINPGAAGAYGFHSVRTAIRVELDGGKPSNLEVWERKR